MLNRGLLMLNRGLVVLRGRTGTRPQGLLTPVKEGLLLLFYESGHFLKGQFSFVVVTNDLFHQRVSQGLKGGLLGLAQHILHLGQVHFETVALEGLARDRHLLHRVDSLTTLEFFYVFGMQRYEG